MIHLDTSFLIRALSPGSVENRQLRECWDAGSPGPAGVTLTPAWRRPP